MILGTLGIFAFESDVEVVSKNIDIFIPRLH